MLGRGDVEAAHQAYHQALPLAIDTESEEYGRLQRLEAKLAHAAGDTDTAMRLLTANADFFTELHNIPEATRSRQLLAMITS